MLLKNLILAKVKFLVKNLDSLWKSNENPILHISYSKMEAELLKSKGTILWIWSTFYISTYKRI